jgi:hypothetical protein
MYGMCGLCETPVTWTCEGVCCECCNIWHHNSCIELCTEDYELLQKSNVQWICCKCESINVTSFTYHTYELDSSNYYEPLTYPESIMDSFTSTTFACPGYWCFTEPAWECSCLFTSWSWIWFYVSSL